MRREFLLLIAIIIAVSQISLADCSVSNKTLSIPAVVNENSSELVKINVETLPGSGQILTTVSPEVGYDTQNSEQTAATVAFAKTNQTECNVILTFGSSNGVSQVDGPSAGGAMTLLLLSALTNKDLRNDFSITGTIEPDGSIGDVGDIPLKAEAVAKSGIPLFLTPNLSADERIGLVLVKRQYNITIAQVSNISDAFELATSSSLPEENLTIPPEDKQTYSNSSVNDWYSSRLRDITNDLIENARNGLTDSDLNFRANFESRLTNAQSAIDANRLYTAANAAFLLLIDEKFSNFTKDNVEVEYKNAESCLNDFTVRNLTLENFEVVGPAEARISWAQIELPKEIDSDNGFVSPMFNEYYNILNAEEWCMVGSEMANYSYPGNETMFDEGVLRDYVSGVLSNVSDNASAPGVNTDLDFHLNSAENSFNSGMYVAALVDAAYVKSYTDMQNITVNESGAILQKELSANYEYVWPNFLIDHAKVLLGTDNDSALRVALIASNMDNYFKEVQLIASNGTTQVLVLGENNSSNAVNTGELPQQDIKLLFVAVIIAVLLLLVFLTIRKRMINRRNKK